MMCTNLYAILVFFAHFVVHSPKIAVAADDIFSIISNTVLERQTDYEFDNPEAITIDPNSTDLLRLKRMFRQYLFLVNEEMDKRSRSKSQNTSTAGVNLRLSAVYINDFFNKDNVKFHNIVCDVSQFEKLSQEIQIIGINENTSSFMNRYQGAIPRLTFDGLVENDDVNYNFTFNMTGPMLREEYEVAPNNEGNIKIKSKLEVFTFDDFDLEITNNSENSDKTYRGNTTTLQRDVNRTPGDANNAINNLFVIEKATAPVHNPPSISKPEAHQVQKVLEKIHTSKAKLLGRLADTWLVNIVEYLNGKYVKPKILAGNEPFKRIHKMNLLEELCANLIPSTIDIPNLEDGHMDIADGDSYRGYEFSRIRIDDLRKFAKCNSFDYSLKTTKESRCREIDNLAMHKITFMYEYSPETEYRSLLNWSFVKKGRANGQFYNSTSERYETKYRSDSVMQSYSDYIYLIIIELSIRTKENTQPIDDPVKVSVELNMNPSNLNAVKETDLYQERLLRHVRDELVKIIKSRVNL